MIPEQAALFANGFADPAADELRLVSGRLLMTLTDDTTLDLEPGAVQVWRLPENGEEPRVADDADFQLVPMTFDQLSSLGLDGGFVQIKYGVLGPTGSGIDVAIALDETGLLAGAFGHVRINTTWAEVLCWRQRRKAVWTGPAVL